MFKRIALFIQHQWFGFRFGFHRAALKDNRSLIGAFNVTFLDGSHCIGVYMAETFVNMLNISPVIPGLFVGEKPKKDTTSTIDAAFFCNKAFLQFTDEEKLGLYFHELGHLVNQHMSNSENLTHGILNSQKCELEADAFAAANGHGVGLHSALTKMADTVADVITKQAYPVALYGTSADVMLTGLKERCVALQQ